MSDHKSLGHIEQVARAIGNKIGESMPEGVGFTLLVYHHGEGGWLTYLSNSIREDMIKAMHEFIEKNESGEIRPPLKDLQ